MAIKVRATRMGWFDLKRVRPGQEFEIEDMQQFGKTWMELVNGKKVSVAVPSAVTADK